MSFKTSLSQIHHGLITKVIFGNMQIECFSKYEKYSWNIYSETNKCYYGITFLKKLRKIRRETPTLEFFFFFCNIAGKTIFATISLLINVFSVFIANFYKSSFMLLTFLLYYSSSG